MSLKVGCISFVMICMLIGACSEPARKVKIIEERDPIIKTLEERDSLIVYPKDTMKKN